VCKCVCKALIYTENMIEERWKNSANAQLKPITVAFNAYYNIDYVETKSIAISKSKVVCQRQYIIFLLK